MLMNKNFKTLILIAGVAIALGIYAWDKSHFTFLDAKRIDPSCEIDKRCGDLVGVDCNAEADGPYYYINKKTGEKIAGCGGFCMTGECTNCPPKEWTCGSY